MAPITESTPTAHTVCDTVITHLAAAEAELRARVLELEGDIAIYRALLRSALDVAHELTDYRRKYHEALDDNRRLRADLRACQLGRAA